MAVYVDQPMPWGKGGRLWCHMEADTVEELHAFAERIGVKRCWYENPKGLGAPHYDLNPDQRARAVAAGAVEKDFRWMSEWRRQRNAASGA